MEKRVSDSALTTVRLMAPTDANLLGNVFGGAIMKYMDEVAAIVAVKHTGKNCVTASVDRMDFYAPVFIGNLLVLKASVNYVGVTSMEVGVRVEAQNPISGAVTHTGSCYFTYVALDEFGKPTPVPGLRPVTKDEKRRFRQAAARRKIREAELAALRKL
ncbi:MAG TPA: acyl-CoA thioesterase [Nitrososphaerales archaeon]|nr:acyl-CoA thioesterase [Nitrososphaerales archaeon]